jgi:hypothetical protein
MRMFCTARGFYLGELDAPELGFDQLVEYFNPFCGEAEPIDGLGCNMDAHVKLLAWFAGETVPNVDWDPVDSFTVAKDGRQVRLFDLKDKIYTYTKHHFNSVFDRQSRDTCVSVRHEWNPDTLTFNTVLRLARSCDMFADEALSKTRTAIASKVKAEYEAEDIFHYEQVVSVFVERLRTKAATRGKVLPALDTNEISVFAEFYREAETTGSYKLNPTDEPKAITSEEVMTGLCEYMKVNIRFDGSISFNSSKSQAPFAGAGGGPVCANVGHGVERAMAGGKEIMHKNVVKV